jgi:O-antigen/teichoic acid export membrane protein
VALYVSPDIYSLGYAMIAANTILLIILIIKAKLIVSSLEIKLYEVKLSSLKGMINIGGWLQIASILILLREPIIKLLLGYKYDLVAVATFELVYRISTQITSIVTTPLLVNYSAAALLIKNRSNEYFIILRQMLSFTLVIFIPIVILIASYSDLLIDNWLGGNYGHVSEVLIWTFMAFALYYTTEALYKAIQATGKTFYSAITQLITLVCMISGLLMFDDSPKLSIVSSVLFGFVVFTSINIIIFKSLYPNLHFFNVKQWMSMLVPGTLYVVANNTELVRFSHTLFITYLLLHLYLMKNYKVFDVFSMSTKLYRMVSAKI